MSQTNTYSYNTALAAHIIAGLEVSEFPSGKGLRIRVPDADHLSGRWLTVRIVNQHHIELEYTQLGRQAEQETTT